MLCGAVFIVTRLAGSQHRSAVKADRQENLTTHDRGRAASAHSQEHRSLSRSSVQDNDLIQERTPETPGQIGPPIASGALDRHASSTEVTSINSTHTHALKYTTPRTCPTLLPTYEIPVRALRELGPWQVDREPYTSEAGLGVGGRPIFIRSVKLQVKLPCTGRVYCVCRARRSPACALVFCFLSLCPPRQLS
jgi:hypothetical protein